MVGPTPSEDRAPGLVFRDPPAAEEEGGRLAREIARVLVRAPDLPVQLPHDGLHLLDVVAVRGNIDLILGYEAPVARLRMRRPPGVGELPVEVTVQEIHASARRSTETLEALATRVARATSPERWREAADLAARLRRLPVGVPMEYHRQIVPGLHDPVGLVRVGYRCNQDCGMCWQSRDWGAFGSDQVRTWIEDFHRAGVRRLLISGGEPTLDPELPRHIRFARELGFVDVTLESNVIRCGREGYAEELRDAGLTSAFVSLHSGDPEVSDAITRAPGTHGRTVDGIRRLLEIGIPVKLNAVMSDASLEHLPALPDFIHDTFASAGRGIESLMLSYPTEPFEKELLESMLPEPGRLRSALRRTVARAIALGLRLDGLDGPCGPALCAFGADDRVASLVPVPGPLDFRVQLPACAGCAVKDACFGVRPEEHALYGDGVVDPVRRP